MVAATLIVEDGTGTNPAANSYASLVQIKNFAAARNYDFSLFSSAQLTGWAMLGMDYIESFRIKFQGVKTNGPMPGSIPQPLQWPRMVNVDAGSFWGTSSWYGIPWGGMSNFSDWSIETPTVVQIDGVDIPNNVIPPQLINAQSQLVIEQAINSVVLFPSTFPNWQVRLQVVGPIRTEYFPGTDKQPLLPAVDIWMKPLMTNEGGQFLELVRT